MLAPILHAIILKTKFDETHDWGHEDAQTDEAEFAELRKKLQNLQKSVAAVDQNLYIEIVSTVVGNTFTRLDQEGSGMDWRDLELALHEMNLFGELALPNSGLAAKSQPNTVAADRLAVMMSKMVDSGRFPPLYVAFWLSFTNTFNDRHCTASPSSGPAAIHGKLRPLLCLLRYPSSLYSSGA
jgi:exportin-T